MTSFHDEMNGKKIEKCDSGFSQTNMSVNGTPSTSVIGILKDNIVTIIYLHDKLVQNLSGDQITTILLGTHRI